MELHSFSDSSSYLTDLSFAARDKSQFYHLPGGKSKQTWSGKKSQPCGDAGLCWTEKTSTKNKSLNQTSLV